MVQIADVKYVVRNVELPKTCPQCGANLTKPYSLLVFEYDVVVKHASIKDGDVNWDEHTIGETLESCVPPIEYQCKWCRHVLAEGMEEKVDGHS
jgi:hypothetical protein